MQQQTLKSSFSHTVCSFFCSLALLLCFSQNDLFSNFSPYYSFTGSSYAFPLPSSPLLCYAAYAFHSIALLFYLLSSLLCSALQAHYYYYFSTSCLYAVSPVTVMSSRQLQQLLKLVPATCTKRDRSELQQRGCLQRLYKCRLYSGIEKSHSQSHSVV